MKRIIGVRFKRLGKIYFFDPKWLEVKKGEKVVVETTQGEEIAEVMSKVSLKHLDALCILYDLNGYYNDLKALLNHMIEKGLSSNERQEGIYFAENLDDIKRILRQA